MDNLIKDTATRLCAKYGFDISVVYDSSGKFSINGGNYLAKGEVGEWRFGSGSSLAAAEEEFEQKSTEILSRDPDQYLREQAAKRGFDLIPSATPLDLKPCTDHE